MPVTLSATDPTHYRVAGWLCAHGSPRGRAVQVLVSGFTYDHTYWGDPAYPAQNSYVGAATAAGFATFAIDRIGTGRSDHPPAEAVTIPAHAYVVHQVIQALRAGTIAGTRFTKVATVGHSLGGAVLMLETSTYQDTDALVIHGMLHALNITKQLEITAATHPTDQDPKFAAAGLPAGYSTTVPGSRAEFYAPEYADPAVIAADEVLKQTTTTGEQSTTLDVLNPSLTRTITAPVLLTVGQQDSLLCDPADPALSCANAAAIRTREAGAYTSARRLDTYVQTRSGHDTNLHRTAPVFFAATNLWLALNLGR